MGAVRNGLMALLSRRPGAGLARPELEDAASVRAGPRRPEANGTVPGPGNGPIPASHPITAFAWLAGLARRWFVWPSAPPFDGWSDPADWPVAAPAPVPG